MGIKFTEIHGPNVLDDLSNLREVELSDLRVAMTGARCAEIRNKLLEELLAVAQAGDGLEYESIPKPFQQTGSDDCQTVALMNGLVTIGARRTLLQIGSSTTQRVNTIRAALRKAALQGLTGNFDPDRASSIDTEGHLRMSTVAAVLPGLGIPLKRLRGNTNPIQLTQLLFQERRFMGVGKAANWHATTIIPLAGANANQFTARLDSLTGTKNVMSLQEFLDLLLSMDPSGQDTFEIYSA